MASRILGMGDILTLVEKAQEEIDLSDAEAMARKMMEATFDFTDFLKQMRLIKNMGSLGGLLKMIPGMNKLTDDQLQKGQDQLRRSEAMINSMTAEERKNPDLLARSLSRKRRVANGSGYQLNDVSKLVSDFQRMRDMMGQMGRMGGFPGMPGMTPSAPPAGQGPTWRGQSSGRPAKPAKAKPKKKKDGGGRGFS